MDRVDVVVVGAGLAGLRCAGELAGAGLEVAVLEASDGVGGRVRTDAHEGFLLDHGFQVLNDAYPEVRRALDVDALQLRRFDDAITVRAGGELHHVVNPLSMPTDVLTLATSSLIPLTQKAKFAAYSATAAALPVSSIRGRRDVSALQAWRDAGLSEETVDRVLRPFFSGVVLDTEFDTSRRFLDLMMRMFVRGRSTLPAAGMQAMPQQLADRLPAGVVRLGTPVREVASDGVAHRRRPRRPPGPWSWPPTRGPPTGWCPRSASLPRPEASRRSTTRPPCGPSSAAGSSWTPTADRSPTPWCSPSPPPTTPPPARPWSRARCSTPARPRCRPTRSCCRCWPSCTSRTPGRGAGSRSTPSRTRCPSWGRPTASGDP